MGVINSGEGCKGDREHGARVIFRNTAVRHDLLGLWNVWMVAGAREFGLLVIV